MPAPPVDPAEAATRVLQIDGPVTMPVSANGWWQRERAAFVRSRIVGLTRPGDIVVDVGCGRADMLNDPRLADRVRINVDSHLWNEWCGRDDMLFVVARADALPFRTRVANLVGSFDVLEHLPDDTRALVEQRRIATRAAVVVAAVPADPRLWSAHDEAVGHHRRYTFDSFSALAGAAQMAVRRRSHFYSFLWLPAWLTRRSAARTTEPVQGTGLASRVVQRIIGLLAAGERRIMQCCSLPFGTSAWFEMVPEGALRPPERG